MPHLCRSPLQVPSPVCLAVLSEFIIGFCLFYSVNLLTLCYYSPLCCPRLSPRALSISQRVSRNCVVPRYSSGWAEAQLSFSKSDSKHLLPVAVGALVTSNTQAIPTGPLVAEEKIGVLLLNLGGPETLEDVQPFLFNLFADPVGNILLLFQFFLCYDPSANSRLTYCWGAYTPFHT